MTKATASDAIITLPKDLGPDAARDLLTALRERLAQGRPVWLEASAVETLGLPAIQILVSAVKRHDSISVFDPSAAFLGAMNESGIVWDHVPASKPQAANGLQVKCEDAQKPLAQLLADETQETPEAPESEITADATMAKRILTIDDSKTMRDMLMLTLSSAGFDVVQAVDGQDGIDVLKRETVDVVITDINMPKMDGYGVIRHLREKREFDAVPILVLTTESDREKKERARDLGATGFIVKPFNPDSLADVIRKVSP
jgi:two-component system chemotaxis response regulator CheY